VPASSREADIYGFLSLSEGRGISAFAQSTIGVHVVLPEGYRRA